MIGLGLLDDVKAYLEAAIPKAEASFHVVSEEVDESKFNLTHKKAAVVLYELSDEGENNDDDASGTFGLTIFATTKALADAMYRKLRKKLSMLYLNVQTDDGFVVSDYCKFRHGHNIGLHSNMYQKGQNWEIPMKYYQQEEE